MDQTLPVRGVGRDQEDGREEDGKQHCEEEGNHLRQESNRQKTMEDTDGGLHPAVDGQSLGER